MAAEPLCPRCTDVMRPWEHAGARMLACGRCGGGLLTPAALATALGPHVRPETWTERGLAHLEGESTLRCPAHGAERPAMRRFAIRHGGDAVEVDVCSTCASIWLDAGEGAQLGEMIAAVHAAERESLPPELTDDAASLDAFDAAVKSDDLLAGQVARGATRRRPVATFAIVALCLGIFLFLNDDAMVRWLAYRPSELSSGERLYGLVTHLVAHYGLGHIAGNLFFLAILGAPLERHLGWALFTSLFVATGVGGFLVHAAFTATPTVPTLGASGAVGGLMGALVAEAPHQRALIGSGKAPTPVQTALIAIGWLVMEVLLPAVAEPNVAWLGHLGGFLSGGVLMLILQRLGLPRPVDPSKRRPRPAGGLGRAFDRATDWISERPAISIPLLGVAFIGVFVLSAAYSEHRECDAARTRAARALRAYADRMESLPPPPKDELRLFEPPTPAEARAKASAVERGEDVRSSLLVGATDDWEANRLLQEAESSLWRAELRCRQ